MCFLKNIAAEESLELNNLSLKEEETQSQPAHDHNVLFPCNQKCMGAFWTGEQQMLVQLFENIDKNNNIISNLNKLLTKNSQQVEKITINFEKQQVQEAQLSTEQEKSRNSHPGSSSEKKQILHKLFGIKKYNFSLQASAPFQDTIYKERNFNIGVKLVDKKGKSVKNSNLLTLCFAISTMEGDWVHQNRVGDAFMKGKTQIELYKGQALFEKLYAREVSRIFPQGKVAIIIYAKPSTLKYLGGGEREEEIYCQEIQPLIIENVSIRAKRKQ